MSTWQRGWWSRLGWAVVLVSMVIAAAVVFTGEGEEGVVVFSGVWWDTPALEREEREAVHRKMQEMERRREARMAAEAEKWEREREVTLAAARSQQTIPPRPARRVRRWAWMSPAQKRAVVWNIPKRETDEAVVTGLVRICTSEQQGSAQDCIGIWQVLNNIRSRTCNRSYTQRITECDERGETLLSAMGRASRYVVGVVEPKHRRQRWIARLMTDCEMPKHFGADVRRYCRGRDLDECSRHIWETQHRRDCEATVKLARGLVSGERPRRITRARVIAWGGRCEDPGGACDDRLACARGLARVPHLEKGPNKPANAFWCPPGSPHCLEDIDPICIRMGYQSRLVATAETAPVNPQGG